MLNMLKRDWFGSFAHTTSSNKRQCTKIDNQVFDSNNDEYVLQKTITFVHSDPYDTYNDNNLPGYRQVPFLTRSISNLPIGTPLSIAIRPGLSITHRSNTLRYKEVANLYERLQVFPTDCQDRLNQLCTSSTCMYSSSVLGPGLVFPRLHPVYVCDQQTNVLQCYCFDMQRYNNTHHSILTILYHLAKQGWIKYQLTWQGYGLSDDLGNSSVDIGIRIAFQPSAFEDQWHEQSNRHWYSTLRCRLFRQLFTRLACDVDSLDNDIQLQKDPWLESEQKQSVNLTDQDTCCCSFDLDSLYKAIEPDLQLGRKTDCTTSNHLTCQLREYQKQCLHWLIDRELQQATNNRNDHRVFHPLWTRCQFTNGNNIVPFYYQRSTGLLTLQEPRYTEPTIHGGILADEMGLGKTVEMIALLLMHPCTDHQRLGTRTVYSVNDDVFITQVYSKATLLLCPIQLMRQWTNELKRHAPTLKVIEYRGIKEEETIMNNNKNKKDKNKDKFDRLNYSEHLSNQLYQADVVISTFAILSQEIRYLNPAGRTGLRHPKRFNLPVTPLMQIYWWRVVVDEAQMIFGNAGQSSEMVNMLQTVNKWCVTSTPIGNSLDDIHGLFEFLEHPLYADRFTFNSNLKVPYEHGNVASQQRMHQLLSQVMWRHSKQTVQHELQLPDHTVQIVPVHLSRFEQQLYDQLEHKYRSAMSSMDWAQKALRLRQCCNDVNLVQDDIQYALLNAHKKQQHARLTLDELEQKMANKNRQYLIKMVDQLNESQGQMECAICLDVSDQIVLTPCLHLFCTDCIVRTMKQDAKTDESYSNCSICRSKFLETELVNVQESTILTANSDNKQSNEPSNQSKNQSTNNNSEYGSKITALLVDLPSGKKTLVFSQWNEFLHLIGSALSKKQIRFAQSFYGSMEQRAQQVDCFQCDPNVNVLLLNTKSSGAGLTLVEATHCFIMDICSNPALEEQAASRIYRIGQREKTFVSKYVVDNSIEQRLLQTHDDTRLLHNKDRTAYYHTLFQINNGP